MTTSRHTFDTPEQAEWFAKGVEWADPGLEVECAPTTLTAWVTDPEQSDEDYDVDHTTEDEDALHCDLCNQVESAADLTPDWNPETGNHLSCEAGNPEGDPTRNGAFG